MIGNKHQTVSFLTASAGLRVAFSPCRKPAYICPEASSQAICSALAAKGGAQLSCYAVEYSKGVVSTAHVSCLRETRSVANEVKQRLTADTLSILRTIAQFQVGPSDCIGGVISTRGTRWTGSAFPLSGARAPTDACRHGYQTSLASRLRWGRPHVSAHKATWAGLLDMQTVYSAVQLSTRPIGCTTSFS